MIQFAGCHSLRFCKSSYGLAQIFALSSADLAWRKMRPRQQYLSLDHNRTYRFVGCEWCVPLGIVDRVGGEILCNDILFRAGEMLRVGGTKKQEQKTGR